MSREALKYFPTSRSLIFDRIAGMVLTDAAGERRGAAGVDGSGEGEVNVTEAPGTIAAKALAVKKENVEVGTGDVVSGKSDGRSETREAEAASRRR